MQAVARVATPETVAAAGRVGRCVKPLRVASFNAGARDLRPSKEQLSDAGRCIQAGDKSRGVEVSSDRVVIVSNREGEFVADQGGPQPGGLLSSWKEIAAYLGVNVRTAQKWEAERGLPVRRLPGGRGRVLVSVEELDAWLQAPREAEPPAAAGGAGSRRSFGRVGILVGVLLSALAVVGALFLSPRRVPAGWRVVADALVVVDVHGRELWTKRFGYALSDYQRFAVWGLNMGWVGDLDSDGEPEVVFLAHPRSGGNPMVYCYSRSGDVRWSFQPGQAAHGFPEELRPPYNPENLLVFRVRGAARIAIASVHHTWYPSQIALLSGEGKLLGEYWHSGHLHRLAVTDASRDGKPLLFAGGIANGYRRAALVALDPERMGGVSREESPEYQLPGTPAQEVARVLFPRSCINRAKDPFNQVMTLHVTPSDLMVGVREESDAPAVVMHRFTTDGRYKGAGLSSRFVARHNELEHAKVLDHRLDEPGETAALSQLQWLTQPAEMTRNTGQNTSR